jgi:hypothetical protein
MVLDGGSPPVGVESTVLDVIQSPPVILRPGGISQEELAAVLGEVRLRLTHRQVTKPRLCLLRVCCLAIMHPGRR